MQINVIPIDYDNSLKRCRRVARNTVNKQDVNVLVSDNFVKNLVVSEHSPVREIRFEIQMYGIPNYVAQHFSRHRIATVSGDFMSENINPVDVEHYVGTSRADRSTKTGDRNEPCDYICTVNVQGLIDMSKVRLCRLADINTRQIWIKVLELIKDIDINIYQVLVPTCIYRGFCPEKSECRYYETQDFNYKRIDYVKFCTNRQVIS